MSSVKFDSLIAEFPEERQAVERLSALLDSCARSHLEYHELTIQRLFDELQPSSNRVLAKLLISAVRHGLIQRKIRVISDRKGGIGDFDSIADVPSVMFDSRIGIEIEVRPDQVQMIYRIPREQLA